MAVARCLSAGLLLGVALLLCTNTASAAWCKCPTTNKPVCGWDMQTYLNACVATFCIKAGVKSRGRCPDTCQGKYRRLGADCSCRTNLDPVCARGITYLNSCAAECGGFGPDCYYKGVCKYLGGKSSEKTPWGPSKPFHTYKLDGSMPSKKGARWNYAEALHMNYLFYESMRSGKLGPKNRINWRGDSCKKCRGLFKEDLSGGYFEAGGSYLKMTQVIAYSVSMIGWSVDAGFEGHKKAQELGHALAAIKWGTDYLIKGHVVKNGQHYMVAQLGHRCIDFAYYGPPELYEQYAGGQWYNLNPYGDRDVAYITRGSPGSEITAMSAAALIIAAKVFKRSGIAPYNSPATIASLEKHARELYGMATKYPGSLANNENKIIKENHRSLWSSKGYKDDLAFAATWMFAHTKNKAYLKDARRYYAETVVEQASTYNNGKYVGFHFDGRFMYPSLHILLAKYDIERRGTYAARANNFLNQYTNGGIATTPRGLVYTMSWGALRVAANAAFLALVHAQNPVVSARSRAKYFRFGWHQVNYMLGDGGRSYVVGFGKNWPKYLWHKPSTFPRNKPMKYGLVKNQLMTRTPGPYTARGCNKLPPYYVAEVEYVIKSNSFPQQATVYGALYGAPLPNEDIVLGRDYSFAEPTLDSNGGLTGALALLAQYFDGKSKPVTDCKYDLGFAKRGVPACWK